MTYPGQEFDDISHGLLSPADYVNPTPKDRYHLVVIGAGPAGLISAIGAAGLGAKVALVERHRMGGDCLNVGCVPSKALLEYTSTYPQADFGEAFAYMRSIRADIAPHDSVERYSEQGVDVFLGAADFDADGQVQVGGVSLNARRVVICTGARAALPPIPGLAQAAPLTNEDVFNLTNAPTSIAILGAGAIGCELATVFARLGIVVHLFEIADRVLPLEILRASEEVAASLNKLGVHLHLGAPVSAIEGDAATGFSVSTASAASSGSVIVEKLLVAAGRRPNTDSLNLANAGVTLTDRGFIETDAKLRTSNKQIFAAGDCTTLPQFTHSADAQARVVVQNSLIAPSASVSAFITPHCTYTSPEVASVGLSESEAVQQGIDVDVLTVELAELDRARARTAKPGFATVVLSRGSDKILGATVVDEEAGELIAPLCLMMGNKLGLSSAQKTQLPYPTRSEYIKRLADAYNRTRVTPMVAKLFDGWLRVFK